MRKTVKILGLGLVIGAVAFMFLATRAQTAAVAEAPGKITIGEIADKFAPVDLEHKGHVEKYGNKCVDCHHEYKEGDAEVKKCSACHDAKVAKDKMVALKDAYHKNCIDCHKKVNAEGKKAPAKCMECHPKK